MTIGLPEAILLLLMLLGLGMSLIKQTPMNFAQTLIGTSVMLGLLWWGGFFG